jgi:hypothetical protein
METRRLPVRAGRRSSRQGFSMLRYVFRLTAIPTLFVIVTIAFS